MWQHWGVHQSLYIWQRCLWMARCLFWQPWEVHFFNIWQQCQQCLWEVHFLYIWQHCLGEVHFYIWEHWELHFYLATLEGTLLYLASLFEEVHFFMWQHCLWEVHLYIWQQCVCGRCISLSGKTVSCEGTTFFNLATLFLDDTRLYITRNTVLGRFAFLLATLCEEEHLFCIWQHCPGVVHFYIWQHCPWVVHFFTFVAVMNTRQPGTYIVKVLRCGPFSFKNKAFTRNLPCWVVME